MNKLPIWLNVVIQWTWGFPQTFLGFIYTIALLKKIVATYTNWGGATVLYAPSEGGSICLGQFVVVSTDDHIAHEIGHYRQSLVLGPLYLLVIGIPSIVNAILCTMRGCSNEEYLSFYTERWAEKWEYTKGG